MCLFYSLICFCVSKTYLLARFLFSLYYRYRVFLVDYVWYPLLLIQYQLPLAAVLFSLPSSLRFWLVLLVGLCPSPWEVFFSYVRRGLYSLFLSFITSPDLSEEFDGISPNAPPLFLHPSLLHSRHIHALPHHLIHPRDFLHSYHGSAMIICASITWVLTSMVSLARLLYVLAWLFCPLGRLIFVPSLMLVLLVLPLILLQKFQHLVGMNPSCFRLSFNRMIGATRQVVAVKASHVVARWFSVTSTDTSESLRNLTESHRASFVENLPMGAPPHFRLIDCHETSRRGSIFLVDWQQGIPYTAISHTWGLPVYAAFDCPCATDIDSSTTKIRWDPKLSCPQTAEHQQTIQDMLCMCKRLHSVADVNYIWHDGVCIAQHDESELYEVMKHMAWIYGNAKETIIFFHYVGKPLVPVAPLGNMDYAQFAYERLQVILRSGRGRLVSRIFPSQSNAVRQLLPRWFSRAWTYQEALVSPKRCYCIRLGDDLASCWTWAEFDVKLKEWDEDELAVKVLEEEELVSVLRKLSGEMLRLMTFSAIAGGEARLLSAFDVYMRLMLMIKATESQVWPKDPSRLLFEASSRECNHKEDRLNSILGLAGVRNFVVRREGLQTLEASTVAFLSKMGPKGLARAMCVVNSVPKTQPWACSWVPDLDKPVRVAASWEDDEDMQGGWISSVEVVQEEGAAVLKMKVCRATCSPIHLSTRATSNPESLEGGLVLHSRVIPQHSATLWRKRLDNPELGLMEELGTCIMECDQHNRLYDDDNMHLFLVCSPRLQIIRRHALLPLLMHSSSSSASVDERGAGGLLWTAPHCALLLSQHGPSRRWFKAGFLSSVSTGLVDALRTTLLAEHEFSIY